MATGFFIQIVVQLWRIGERCLCAFILTIQNPQGVGIHPALAVFIQRINMLLQIGDEGFPIALTGLRITEGIQFQRHMLIQAQSLPE